MAARGPVRGRGTFKAKLWLYFSVFAVVLLAALWLLQTVFLQGFYDGMSKRNVARVAERIEVLWGNAGGEGASDVALLASDLDELARDNALLIFVADAAGGIVYGTDEHSGAYGSGQVDGYLAGHDENPYRDGDDEASWLAGARRFASLPQDFGELVERLAADPDRHVSYVSEDGSTYVYGLVLTAAAGEKGALGTDGSDAGGLIVYISTPLQAVGATVDILRVQLLWTTAASLMLALVLALAVSRRFARPVTALTEKARCLAEGAPSDGAAACVPDGGRGFCTELDEVADALDQASEELARLESYRLELLANVSHDLRTPLTLIKGYAEELRDYPCDDPAQRTADLEVIVREADRLTDLVNEILTYSTLRARAVCLEEAPFDLAATVCRTTGRFAALCARRGCSLEVEAPEAAWAYGDERLVERVVYNLVGNALDHAGTSARVEVEVAPVPGSSGLGGDGADGGANGAAGATDDATDGGMVRVEVRDFGPGIAPEDLAHVWDRYFTRGQRGRTAVGSGLGLAICREVLEAHGARYGVLSEQGAGATFWFELAVPMGRSPLDSDTV